MCVMSIVIGILGLVLTLGLGFLLSNDKKNINFKAIGVLFVLQILLALFMFKTSIGVGIVETVSNFVTKVLSYGYQGIEFVVGGWAPPESKRVLYQRAAAHYLYGNAVVHTDTYSGAAAGNQVYRRGPCEDYGTVECTYL